MLRAQHNEKPPVLYWKSCCSVICRFASFARLIGDASEETKELLREFDIVEVSSMLAKSSNLGESRQPGFTGSVFSSLNFMPQASLLHRPALS